MIRAALLAVFLPSAATALSCITPDVARDFQTASASQDVYVVVTGSLTFDVAGVPETSFEDPLPPKPVTDLPARLIGRSLSQEGFVRAFDQPVTLRINCFAAWCAAPVPGTVLAFLKREAGGYVVHTDPCGTMTHADPSQDTLDRVTACFRGQPCTPRDGF